MPEPRPNGQRYEVHCSAAVAQVLKELQEQVSLAGGGKTVAAAFRHVVQRLETAPMEVGDPAYRLPALRMQVRTVVVRPLIVYFGVCEDRPLVFIKGVKLWE
jgi:hypothetical protein